MYPIEQILSEVYAKYRDNQAIIVSSPTATGKSTILPLDILKRNGNDGGKIIMLEPRRLAAKTIAIRMADLLGEKIGETIGYSIRFESVKSEKTRLEVVTEGILTRMIQSDNELAGISTIIFDEFHERNLNAELALALCRECQKILRPDLKIIKCQPLSTRQPFRKCSLRRLSRVRPRCLMWKQFTKATPMKPR